MRVQNRCKRGRTVLAAKTNAFRAPATEARTSAVRSPASVIVVESTQLLDEKDTRKGYARFHLRVAYPFRPRESTSECRPRIGRGQTPGVKSMRHVMVRYTTRPDRAE